jgi:hypothetical protein
VSTFSEAPYPGLFAIALTGLAEAERETCVCFLTQLGFLVARCRKARRRKARQSCLKEALPARKNLFVFNEKVAYNATNKVKTCNPT